MENQKLLRQLIHALNGEDYEYAEGLYQKIKQSGIEKDIETADYIRSVI